MTDEEILSRRFCELAESCYAHGRYTFTDFLGLAELDLFFRAAPDFSYVPYTLFGGAEGCERVMVRFGDEESLGYAPPPFPIACLGIAPNAPKFAEPLSHRDCLGALMNLGIRRECTGDIFLSESGILLFCEEKLAPYLMAELTRIRHTPVTLTEVPPPPSVFSKTEESSVQVASERADGIVAHVLSLSRTDAAALFVARRVFVNGRVTTDGSRPLRAGDQCTVRGFGRFTYGGVVGQTRKGKLSVRILRYV